MNAKEYNSEMKRIIVMIRDGSDLCEANLSFESMECLNECLENGYIIGVKTMRVGTGNLVADIINPKVTQKGLEFIKPHHPNLRANIAILISLLALLVAALTGLDEIVKNIKMLIPS